MKRKMMIITGIIALFAIIMISSCTKDKSLISLEENVTLTATLAMTDSGYISTVHCLYDESVQDVISIWYADWTLDGSYHEEYHGQSTLGLVARNTDIIVVSNQMDIINTIYGYSHMGDDDVIPTCRVGVDYIWKWHAEYKTFDGENYTAATTVNYTIPDFETSYSLTTSTEGDDLFLDFSGDENEYEISYEVHDQNGSYIVSGSWGPEESESLLLVSTISEIQNLPLVIETTTKVTHSDGRYKYESNKIE